MKIVILLGGVGKRFATVGYQKPKPFLLVDGKTMLEHVVSMYPGAHEYIFACNEQFVENETLIAVTKKLPNSKIISVPSHTAGPVQTLSYVWDDLRDEDPVLVSYCDFYAAWDFADFLHMVEKGWDGAVPSYTGFHPHLLHKKKYAGIMADIKGRMLDIREKHSFTENPEDSFHSAGIYYFSSAREMKKYGKALIESGEKVQNEQYISMMYYQYLADKKNILVYPLKHFFQWGTPEDLEEYDAWMRLIHGSAKGVTDIPQARLAQSHVPYLKDTPTYQKSLAYWREYYT